MELQSNAGAWSCGMELFSMELLGLQGENTLWDDLRACSCWTQCAPPGMQ